MKSLEESLKTLGSEEIAKFEKSFKDPKFMELLADYAKDMADPETKAEQEQYLRQLEEEGRAQEVYGKGMQLVLPTPAFVAKTANSQSGQKVFINVCTSDKVAVATSKRVKPTGGSSKGGLQWDVPLMLSKCKEGSDRNRIQCMVFDFVVHPDTCRMAHNNARFKILILDSAADSIEKQMGWTLTRHYSFPKLPFKTTPGVTQPSTMRQDIQPPLTQAPLTQPTTAAAPQGAGSSPAAIPCQQDSKPLVTEVTSPVSSKSQESGKTTKSSGFRFPSARVHKQDAAPIRSRRRSGSGANQASSTTSSSSSSSSSRLAPVADAASDLMTPVATTRMEAVPVNADACTAPAELGQADGLVQPDYELVYRGHMDLAQAWEGPGLDVASARLPKELVVRIHLPGTQHAKQAQLNIEPQKLSLSVAGKYNLQLSLPHKVAGAEGTASFHSGKQQLEVVLPVVPPPIPADRPNTARGTTQQQPCRVNTQSDDGGVGDAHELIESMDEAVSTATSSAYIAPAAEAAANELPSMNHSQQHSSRDREATAQQERTKPQPLTNNQQRWLDLHPKNQPSSDASMQASTSQTAVAADTDTLRAAAAAGDTFIASPTFGGRLANYVFTSRDRGVGYYKDACVTQLSPEHAVDAAVSNALQKTCESIAQPFVLKPRLCTRALAEELD